MGVQRRYREFEQLKQHLSDEKIKITNFPGKRLWGSSSPSVVSARSEQLTEFLRGPVLSNTDNAHVAEFLELNKAHGDQCEEEEGVQAEEEDAANVTATGATHGAPALRPTLAPGGWFRGTASWAGPERGQGEPR